MRVLIVCLSVNFAGAERHAVELANALAESHDVALVLREAPAEAKLLARYAALREVVAPGVAVFLAGRALPAIGLSWAILRFRPDVIHAHNERSARWATRLPFGVPVVATNHCGYADDYDRCDTLICLTPTQIAELGKRFRGRAVCIGNWVLPHPRPSREAVLALRASLGLTAEDYVVGSVGRLAAEKDFAGLIDGFLAAGLPAAKLVIVGDGEEAPRLRALAAAAAGRIVLTGFRRDVRSLYRVFDLFALNSRTEQFVLTVLEALDAGLPVIATATTGAREIAARSPIRLVPIGDTAALADALRQARAGLVQPSPDGAGPFRMAAVLPQIVAVYAEAFARRRATSYDSTMPSTTHT
jgi:glycosyltransferase involved in cell wall biosynthesis